MSTYMTTTRNTMSLGLGPLLGRLRDYIDYRHTLAALEALPTEVLADLGLERRALKQAARASTFL